MKYFWYMSQYSEAALQRCSLEKVFWKYEANLQEWTHAEVWFPWSCKEDPCRNMISINLPSNFIEITLWHGCSPVNLLHIFRTPFCRNTSEWLPLFFIKKNSQGSRLVKTDVWWQNLALGKFQNLIGKVIFVCPGKAFTIYEPNCTYICRRNRTV